jgi:hypothetical protein
MSTSLKRWDAYLLVTLQIELLSLLDIDAEIATALAKAYGNDVAALDEVNEHSSQHRWRIEHKSQAEQRRYETWREALVSAAGENVKEQVRTLLSAR